MFAHKTCDKDNYKGLGNKIKRVRESSNLSQEYVASKINLSQQAYSHMEKNLDIMTELHVKPISGGDKYHKFLVFFSLFNVLY